MINPIINNIRIYIPQSITKLMIKSESITKLFDAFLNTNEHKIKIVTTNTKNIISRPKHIGSISVKLGGSAF